MLQAPVSDYTKASRIFDKGSGWFENIIKHVGAVALKQTPARFLLRHQDEMLHFHAYSPFPRHFILMVSARQQEFQRGQPTPFNLFDPKGLMPMAEKMADFGTWVYNHNTRILEWSENTSRIYGARNQKRNYDNFLTFVHPDERRYVEETFFSSLKSDSYELEYRIIRESDAAERYLHQKGIHQKDASGKVNLSWGIVKDVTDQIMKAIALDVVQTKEKQYRQLFDNMNQGFALYDIIRREDNYPVDYRYMAINPAFETLTGMKSEDILGKTMKEFFPEAEGYWYDTFAQVTITGKPIQFQNYFEGLKRYFDLWIFKPSENQIAVIFTNITEQKRSLELIQKLTKGIEQSPAVVMITDTKGRIEYVNPKFTEVTGYTAEEALGKNPNIQKSGIHGKEFYRHLWKTILSGEDWRGIIANKSKSGELYWESAFISPIKDDDGVIKNFISIKENITKRVEAERTLIKNEKKYRLIFENVPVGIFYINKKGIITDCNQNFVDITELSREKLLGLDYTQLPDQRIVNLYREILLGQPAVFEGDYTSVFTRKTTSVSVMLSPVMNVQGEVDGAIGLVEDRTIQNQQQMLEKQVALAKEAIKFKQNFLANMSHEIRTPLTGIVGMLDILKETQLDQSQKEYLNIMENSSENLMEIVNQVLDFSKIEAGKLKIFFQEFDLHKMIRERVNAFSKVSRSEVELKAHIDKNIPALVRGDKGRLSQVINNLMNNAMKFTEKGKVTLTAELINKEMKPHKLSDRILLENPVKVKITIADTGIGIADDRQADLFNPFTQLHADHSRIHSGTGLGLAICKQLVEQHGGEIGFSSELGKGSQFFFTFLADQGPQQHTVDEITDSIDFSDKLEGMRILMAEDKKVNQKVFYIILRSMGFSVTFTANGQELLDTYQPGKYDIILMDIQMPVMDGLTATHKLKEKYTELPPVIGLSANAFEGDREKYMNAGLDEYITKPLKPVDLIEVLQKLNVI